MGACRGLFGPNLLPCGRGRTPTGTRPGLSQGPAISAINMHAQHSPSPSPARGSGRPHLVPASGAGGMQVRGRTRKSLLQKQHRSFHDVPNGRHGHCPDRFPLSSAPTRPEFWQAMVSAGVPSEATLALSMIASHCPGPNHQRPRRLSRTGSSAGGLRGRTSAATGARVAFLSSASLFATPRAAERIQLPETPARARCMLQTINTSANPPSKPRYAFELIHEQWSSPPCIRRRLLQSHTSTSSGPEDRRLSSR